MAHYSTDDTVTYRMHPYAPAVLINEQTWGGAEYAINRESLLVSIATIKAQRDVYHTQEAYDYALSVKEGALAYLDKHLAERAVLVATEGPQ